MIAVQWDRSVPLFPCYLARGDTLGNSEKIQEEQDGDRCMDNPPGNPKAQYFVNKDFPPRADRWLEGAESFGESWWLRWKDWLSERSGEMKAAPKSLGNKANSPVAQAPGEYVFT